MPWGSTRYTYTCEDPNCEYSIYTLIDGSNAVYCTSGFSLDQNNNGIKTYVCDDPILGADQYKSPEPPIEKIIN